MGYYRPVYCNVLPYTLIFYKYKKADARKNSCICLSVSKKSTRSWTGMPLARKSKIFGLHSIPANTTPVPLKNRLFSGFSLIMCFSAAHVSGKTKDAA